MNPTAALRPSPSKTLAAGGTAHQLAGPSIAENTRRAYAGALRRLEEWLGGQPLNDPLLAAYLGHLFDAGVSPSVAAQVVASVRFRAHLAGIPSQAGEATARVLAGFRRAGRQRQSAGRPARRDHPRHRLRCLAPGIGSCRARVRRRQPVRLHRHRPPLEDRPGRGWGRGLPRPGHPGADPHLDNGGRHQLRRAVSPHRQGRPACRGTAQLALGPRDHPRSGHSGRRRWPRVGPLAPGGRSTVPGRHQRHGRSVIGKGKDMKLGGLNILIAQLESGFLKEAARVMSASQGFPDSLSDLNSVLQYQNQQIQQQLLKTP